MNSKIAKEIRRFIRQKYPKLEQADKKEFDKVVKFLKNKYKNTPWNKKQEIKIEG